MKRRVSLVGCLVLALTANTFGADPATAQWSGVYEQFYLPAEHNWNFRDHYPAADRLFNAFDYGHAILYETLYTEPEAPASVLEDDEYDFITSQLLVKPPRVPLEEAAIEVAYAKLAPEAKTMFDWAHLLHRQIYDVLADESMNEAEKDDAVAELLRYYRSRPDIVFSSKPKSMDLMEGQSYSTAFRTEYPKFNGLIWAYHWLQVGLYEPLLAGTTHDERQTGVIAAVARFWQMLEDPPDRMPRVMPMTAEVAPLFAQRYPEAAIIFDNLHSMHDVVSDILTNPAVPREKKREEILRAAARYRDDTSYVVSEEEWREMASMMGIQNMGGPAIGYLAELPVGTVPRGAVMAHGRGHPEGHEGMEMEMEKEPTTPADAHGHAAGAAGNVRQPEAGVVAEPAEAERREAIDLLVERLLSDSSIRERIASDPELRRLAGEATGEEIEEQAPTPMAPASAQRHRTQPAPQPTPPPSHGGHRTP